MVSIRQPLDDEFAQVSCLEAFDKNVAAARKAIAAASDEQLMKSWSLVHGGHKTIFTMPRAAVLRSFCLNHIIHHRGAACGLSANEQRGRAVGLRPFCRRKSVRGGHGGIAISKLA